MQPDYRRNEMLGFIRQGLQDFSISRAGATWGIPFPIAENGETAQREDGSWDPEAGTIYVWYDALINYITGAGFPDDLEAFQRWWPADLHVIGKDIARFHTIYWPAMLWSAGLEPPRHVWVHGWLLVAGGERMSKSLGNFLEPQAVVAAFGADGARYTTLREVAFDRDTEVSWDSFRRRYNADLANDFGNLVNRTVSMVNRYLGGERPAPRAAADSPLGEGWAETLRALPRGARRLPAPRRARRAVGVRGRGEQDRRRRAAVDAREGGEGGRRGGGRAAPARARRPRGGVPADRPRRRAVHARGCAADPRAAGPRLPVRRRRQRRPGHPAAARVGRRCGRGRPRDRHARRRCSRGSRPRRPSRARLTRRAAYDRAMRLVDSHGHLNADRFDGDVELVVGAARLAGLERLPGAGLERALVGARARARRALAVARRRGRRPSARRRQGRRRRLGGGSRAWARDERVLAIGETGLDSDRLFSPWPDQLDNLRRNLALALETGKPAILHCRSKAGERDAQDALVEELRAAGFDGDGAAARRSGTGRPRSSTRSAARSTTRRRSSRWASRSRSRASCSGAARRRRRRR